MQYPFMSYDCQTENINTNNKKILLSSLIYILILGFGLDGMGQSKKKKLKSLVHKQEFGAANQ